MITAVIYGISWAGIIMLLNYTFWEGNLFASYFNWLKKKNTWWAKPIGACTVCTGFWFGFGFAYLFHYQDYVIFLGVSEGLLVLYSATLIKWFK